MFFCFLWFPSPFLEDHYIFKYRNFAVIFSSISFFLAGSTGFPSFFCDRSWTLSPSRITQGFPPLILAGCPIGLYQSPPGGALFFSLYVFGKRFPGTSPGAPFGVTPFAAKNAYRVVPFLHIVKSFSLYPPTVHLHWPFSANTEGPF